MSCSKQPFRPLFATRETASVPHNYQTFHHEVPVSRPAAGFSSIGP